MVVEMCLMSTSRLRLASALVLPLLVATTTARIASAQGAGTSAPGAAAAPPATPPPASPMPPPPPPPPGGQPAPAYTGAPVYAPPPAQPQQTDVPAESGESAHPKKRIGIFVDPLNLALGTLGAEVSFSPAKVVALNLGLQYRKDDVGTDPVSREQIDLKQYGVVFGAQIFPLTDRWMRGFYLYPRGTVVRGSTNATRVWQEASTSGIEGLVMAGYQFRWDVGFAIRVGGGIGYRKIEVELKPKQDSGVIVVGPTSAGREGPAIALEGAVGWCF